MSNKNLYGNANKVTESASPKTENYERKTFMVRKDLFSKLNLIAAKESILQKDIIEFALETAIARYEKKHGELDISKMKGQKRDVSQIF